MPHIVMGSVGRAFQGCGGQGGPREVVARGRGRTVLPACSARVAQTEGPRGMFPGLGARVGQCRLAPLLAMCCMMSMGLV